MIVELHKAFKKYSYKDSSHKYIHTSGKNLVSVTQFLSKIKPEFNRQFWTVYKAYEFSGHNVKYDWKSNTSFFVYEKDLPFGSEYRTVSIYDDHSHLKVTPDQVADQWYQDSLIGTTRGSYLHQYLEDRENRLLDSPDIPIVQGLTTLQQVKFFNSLKQGVNICDKFLQDTFDYLIPAAMEYTIGDIDLGLAGRFDRLYFNTQTNNYEIWDFKTDKKISTVAKGSDKFKIFDITNTDLNKYSLQTSLYKYIIEKNCNLILGQSRIVHIDLKNDEYKIYNCKDYTSLIKEKKDEICWTTY